MFLVWKIDVFWCFFFHFSVLDIYRDIWVHPHMHTYTTTNIQTYIHTYLGTYYSTSNIEGGSLACIVGESIFQGDNIIFSAI